MADTDRVARWDQIRRNQLSFAINLILTLSTGELGFFAATVMNENFRTYSINQKDVFISAFVVADISTAFGSLATVSRLCDFRLTAQIDRQDEKCAEKPWSDVELECARTASKSLGHFTWWLFAW
jgi:capsule polysaccharide export protein KpsC/LpsZ